jgi:hypothetical protein
MPIPFVPYKKEYAEQMRILVALLGGKLSAEHVREERPPSPYPRLTGLFQNKPVQVRVIQRPTRNGADPLNTDKYLDILFESPCSLRLSVETKGHLWWIKRLLWWKTITTGEQDLDRDYTFSSPNVRRARRLLAHKKVKSQLFQLIPFEFLSISEDHLQLRHRITSHRVFSARHLAEVLRRMLRLSRLCQNLG